MRWFIVSNKCVIFVVTHWLWLAVVIHIVLSSSGKKVLCSRNILLLHLKIIILGSINPKVGAFSLQQDHDILTSCWREEQSTSK